MYTPEQNFDAHIGSVSDVRMARQYGTFIEKIFVRVTLVRDLDEERPLHIYLLRSTFANTEVC